MLLCGKGLEGQVEGFSLECSGEALPGVLFISEFRKFCPLGWTQSPPYFPYFSSWSLTLCLWLLSIISDGAVSVGAKISYSSYCSSGVSLGVLY
jgi:hypothetical protein